MLEAVIHACTGILHEMRREEHHERMAAHEALRQATRKLTFATIGLVIVTGALVAVDNIGRIRIWISSLTTGHILGRPRCG